MRYKILGVTQAEDDHGTAVPVTGPRLRTLLTALALRPGRVTTPDTLIDEVWSDTPPHDAPAALQALIGRLRRTLGKDTITSAPGGYRLEAAEDDVDLFVFERLVRQGTTALDQGDAHTAARTLSEALALYRGPALADLPDPAAATRPAALHLEATRARIDADLRLGRAQAVVPHLKELTEAHPYDEPLHALLIRALRDTGRTADALAAYETARRALADGLGADPGPQLRALHTELLAPPDASAVDRQLSHSRPADHSRLAGRGEWPAARAESPAARAESPYARPEFLSARGQSPSALPESPSARPESLSARPESLSARPASPSAQPENPSSPAESPTPPHEPPTRTGNLRPRLTSFVGREPELDAIRSELHRARLVTLTGPGGSGKTRLAEEAAAGLPQAWLVELAPLDRPEAVPGAVVSALGLRETVLMTTELTTPQDDPVALLVEHCAARSELLILDNCEHVIEAAATLAETLLTHCPGLTILATSREPLGVPGESVRPVEPLVPDQAHRLFEERASTVRPDAAAVLRDREAVDEICRRLDGLPLAIELAAARLRLLTPRQIADRLDDRFRLLTSGSRTVLPRQQTLRAVVDWSWDLLDERERTVLREVSVFAGGWDLTAAEAVCTAPAADLIGALVDKSLIVATPDEHSGGGMRYRMLETIHEYATERAAEVPELRAEAERRHRAWVRALVEKAEPLLRSADQLPWISRLETELDNIRAALHRALADGAEEEAGALALDMGWFCWLRNYRQEAIDWLVRVLRLGAALDAEGAVEPVEPAHSADPAERMALIDPMEAFLAAPNGEMDHPQHTLRMNLRMLHLFLRSDTERMDGTLTDRPREYVTRLRDHFGQGGPQAAQLPGIAWPLATFVLGSPADARAALDATVVNCREYGDEWTIGVALMFRTHMAVDSAGGMKGIDEDLAELRVLSRRVGDRWMRAQVCSAAGEAAMARSRLDEAKGEYEEALRLAYEVGAYAETPFLLARLGEIAYRAGDRATALRGLDDAATAADRYGVPDTRAFLLLMRAQMALDVKDIPRAREMFDAARAETGRGTPPPQFTVMLNAIDAMVTVAETGPEHGLPKLVRTIREAVDRRCADVITAALVDGAAVLLSDLGEHPRALRMLAAAEQLRGGAPRPMPEGAEAERAKSAARAALSTDECAAESARGALFTVADVLTELDEAMRRHPAGQLP
ncbi:AfsR/SARP family transcriptional regulator [Streptomyces sp. NBC_00588]|uniref:AfsR/SARP family transcriptional regulator n=1 Tax=Streptomyces sp. NBC_00588 TaxID=2975784 RepID=UPI002E80104B|nr:BTAD domain-containing putative transcriptional regulator [Streptomyces sp. NBC_00588]WUB36894.1 winged helix-turn-helix domain-containing protein [Streptomyces sp. NBC_00588]